MEQWRCTADLNFDEHVWSADGACRSPLQLGLRAGGTGPSPVSLDHGDQQWTAQHVQASGIQSNTVL